MRSQCNLFKTNQNGHHSLEDSDSVKRCLSQFSQHASYLLSPFLSLDSSTVFSWQIKRHRFCDEFWWWRKRRRSETWQWLCMEVLMCLSSVENIFNTTFMLCFNQFWATSHHLLPCKAKIVCKCPTNFPPLPPPLPSPPLAFELLKIGLIKFLPCKANVIKFPTNFFFLLMQKVNSATVTFNTLTTL